jgi:hypothetical protein
MTTFGDQVFQYGGSAVSGPLSTGPAIYVKGSTGSDGHRGNRPDRSVKTWGKAQTLMSADLNGVIYFVAESNSAGSTNIVLPASSTFTFSKNGVKVQGINQNGMIGQRSRVTIAANATNVTPMINWSASNSSCANVHFVYNENDAGDKGCFDVSGERNYFYRCHFAGIGNDAQDVADAYSLKVTGDENLFEECTIGLDTTGRGDGDNSELVLASSATRNIFLNCLFITYAANVAGHQMIKTGDLAIDRFVLFKNCTFINSGVHSGGSVTMTELLDVDASPSGTFAFDNCTYFGIAEIEAGDITGVLAAGSSAHLNQGVAFVPTTATG